jgi:hypothetical protein
MRKWLDAVELVEKKAVQDPDIKDKEGTQPAKYHKGLKKSTKNKRDAHFKKHGKKADDDESAYKPAPGDKTAKTKPSKYTKAFKDMYDEDCWDGYKQVGMKKKGNKSVPNCVPVNEYGGPKISKADYLKKQRSGITISTSENAGEEGTNKLLKKYKKDTPMEDAVANAKDRIKAEKERDKKKHDGILDRARLARAKAKNRETK